MDLSTLQKWLGTILCAAGLFLITPGVLGGSPASSDATQNLLAAAKSGDLKKASEAITAGADVNARGKEGKSALHLAAFRGNAKIAALLLDSGGNVEERDARGETPLHVAAAAGRRGVLTLLLERGADPLAKDTMARTPIQYAKAAGKDDLAAILQKAPRPARPSGPFAGDRVITDEDLERQEGPSARR